MGNQQLLLVILSAILVGIAIAIAWSLFSVQSVQANKDQMINDVNTIAAYCYQYRTRPASIGGGQGSYIGVFLPSKFRINVDANTMYVVKNRSQNSVTIRGENMDYPDQWVEGVLDDKAKFSQKPPFNFGPDFE